MSGADDTVSASGAQSRGPVRFPPPLIYVGGFLLGILLEVVVPIGGLPTGLAIAAGLLGFAGWMALDGWAMRLFARARTPIPPMRAPTALVTTGPYRFTRNPIYLGMAVLYSGLALAFGVIWALAVLPFVLLVIDRQVIAREERYLERKFGDEYRAFKRSTRRWL